MDDVNMRSRANTTSVVLKKIKAGDTVTILGVTGSFYRVKFEGKTGYAMKKFIDGTDPSPDPTPNPALSMQAPPAITEYPYDTTTIDRVKLRKKAQAEGEVILTIPAGSLLTVYDRTDNGFAKVKYNGKTGYVVDTHVNLANIPAPTPVPTATPKPGSEKYTELKNGDKGQRRYRAAIRPGGAWLPGEGGSGRKIWREDRSGAENLPKAQRLCAKRHRQPGVAAKAVRGYAQGYARLPPVC